MATLKTKTLRNAAVSLLCDLTVSGWRLASLHSFRQNFARLGDANFPNVSSSYHVLVMMLPAIQIL